MFEVRDAVAADIQAFYGQNPPQSLRARVLVRGDEVLGIAGYYMENGHAVVFSDSKHGIPKMTIWRESLKFMAELNLPAICRCEGSAPFLERLGWQHVEGDVYQWPV